MDRRQAGHTYQTSFASRPAHINVQQLVWRVQNDSEGNPTVKALQAQLHRWSHAFSKDTISELVWHCALFEPDTKVLKAIVLPDGVWQEAIHGCWTLLQLPYVVAHNMEVTSPSTLLHEVARNAQSQKSREVVNMIVHKNPGTLTFSHQGVYNHLIPANVAIYYGALPEVVVQLAPISVAAIWQTDPTPFEYIQPLANDAAQQRPVAVRRFYQAYHEQLRSLSIKFAEDVEAERIRQEQHQIKLQRQQERQKQRDEHYTLAVKILEKMPEVLSAAAPEDQTPGPAENLG